MNISELQNIIKDKNRLIVAEKIEDKYLSDVLGHKKGIAQALIFPLSTEEVSNILKYSWKNNVPVTARGAGTNLVGSTVPVKGGIILDFSKMNNILELDKETFTVTVESGILLKDLQSFVESKGLFYPPDPGEKEASIGGNISTNAGGMRAVKYGVTRNYVSGLEIVTADGTVLTVGGKNIKDASGLSLKNLIIGSEGTLAVITKAVLRLIPKPEVTQSVLIPYSDLQIGIKSVLTILNAGANPTAVEFIERKVVQLGEQYTGYKYPYPEAGSYILLTLDGGKAEVEENTKKVRDAALKTGALDFLVITDSEVLKKIWLVRGCLVKAVEETSEQEPVDIVVPINHTSEFIEYINKLEKESGIQMIAFGHAGDGNVHLCVVRGNRDKETWEKELQSVMEKAYKKAYEFGGLTSGEHGIGISKRHYFLQETPSENLDIMNKIKDALDPKHILNDLKSYII